MTKITTFNVNGIRAAVNKGFYDWLKKESPDILCVQETKAQPEQIDTKSLEELGYYSVIHSAIKKGYSGVAVFSKQKPSFEQAGIGIELFDSEGRLLRADFDDLTVINSYFPSGTTGDIRQQVKMDYLEAFQDFINKLKLERPNLILAGDFNICHKAIDINKPENKKGVSGFLPEEREWVTRLLSSGFTDSFREFDKSPNKYTWWSYRAGARQKNLGWRIDYQMISLNLKNKLSKVHIHSDVYMSDHCPYSIWLD